MIFRGLAAEKFKKKRILAAIAPNAPKCPKDKILSFA